MTSAAEGAFFDSAYAGESAFLVLSPGQVGYFVVFFLNTGTVPWIRASTTRVDLSVCGPDKISCDVTSPNAEWNPGTWLSPSRYATQEQEVVFPGQIATFKYSVLAPSAVPAGTFRFGGDLVVSVSGRTIHPEGYFHDVTVAHA